MAVISRTNVIRLACLMGFFLGLIILNMSSYRFNIHRNNSVLSNVQFSSPSYFGPKRVHSSKDLIIANNSNNNSHNNNNSTILNKPQPSTITIPVKVLNSSEIIGSQNNASNYYNYTVHENCSLPDCNLEIGNDVDTQVQSTNTIKVDISDSKVANSNTNLLSKIMTKLGLNACPVMPPDLDGPFDVKLEEVSMKKVEEYLGPKLSLGGFFRPDCNAKDRVAIVIPFRNRETHLPILLRNLHPMLMKQQIEYQIFVVEQTSGGEFNRASLMNVGFLEANKMHNWDCFIFHDVDLIPMNDRNLYNCPEQPRHMSVAVDTLNFKLPYSTIFGGVSALTTEQFKSVNGFSNSYLGWGGEDDDISTRIRFRGYHISRYPVNIARYTMLTHKKEKANPKRYEKLANGLKRFETDGLNSIKYKVLDFQNKPLYGWIYVQLNPEES